jgi:hypothetical protein
MAGFDLSVPAAPSRAQNRPAVAQPSLKQTQDTPKQRAGMRVSTCIPAASGGAVSKECEQADSRIELRGKMSSVEASKNGIAIGVLLRAK